MAPSGRASRMTNVCFAGKNGHIAGVTPFPLLTQSGRWHFKTIYFSTLENLAVRIINNPPRLYCILNNIIVDDQQKWHQITYLVHQ
jgi:hypothetical protein